MNNDDKMELIGQMIDIFEDFLDGKKGEAEKDDVNIQGTDYDRISDSLKELMDRWKLTATPKHFNTRFEYLYRDASNYKKKNIVVLKGTLSRAQIKRIINACDGGEFFIPSQVGLPENRFPEINEDDHCWFELDQDSFSKTEQEPTESITAEELYRKFITVKWDDTKPFGTTLGYSFDKYYTLFDKDKDLPGRYVSYQEAFGRAAAMFIATGKAFGIHKTTVSRQNGHEYIMTSPVWSE